MEAFGEVGLGPGVGVAGLVVVGGEPVDVGEAFWGGGAVAPGVGSGHHLLDVEARGFGQVEAVADGTGSGPIGIRYSAGSPTGARASATCVSAAGGVCPHAPLAARTVAAAHHRVGHVVVAAAQFLLERFGNMQFVKK